MSIITQLVTATAIATVSPTVLTDTVTCYIATTLPASAGQTVTINLPPVVPPPMPTTKYTPSPPTAATVTAVLTATMIDFFLQDLKSVIYSTWVVSLNPTAIPAASGTPAPLVYVVEPQNDGGWDTWSTDARVGLIVGVVFAGLFLLAFLCWCCCRRSNLWFVHRWPWSRPMDTPSMGQGMSIVQPTMVNGPILPYSRQGHIVGYV